MADLAALGWNESFAKAFAALPDRGLVPGRVALEHNHVYRVLTAEGEWLAEASGRLKFRASGRHELPAVGDWVGVERPVSGDRARLRAILPRRTQFSRKQAGRETREQVVAANIDVVLLVIGLDAGVKPRSLERYLLLVRQSGARPAIVLNKADLVEASALVEQVEALATGVPVLAVSARDGRGMEALRETIHAAETAALLGPSGAGKSSIINRLAGEALLETGDVRDWDRRGRHTSVHRQLVPLPGGGLLIDTPGVRELSLWDADGTSDETFPEITALAAACRFRDCRHDQEPGCAVKAAVAGGRLDAGRYESYLKLRGERDDLARRQDERAQIEQRRQARVVTRAQKALEKQRDR